MKEKHNLDVQIESEDDLLAPNEDLKVFLFQAVRELLFNVVKHAGVQKAYVRLFTCDNDMGIEVRDYGKGFDPAAILEKKSVGFGLFNVRERIEIFRGRFDIESRPGIGSKIVLYAPGAKLKPKRNDVERVDMGVRGKETRFEEKIRVLVVDDHKILRQGLINLLKGQKQIEVVGDAGDGLEAVQKAIQLEPDVILMDVSMPKLNGIEATTRIKSECPQIEIIGLSLHDTEDMAATMIKAGACAYHSKSGPIDEIVQSIRRIYAARA